MEVTVNFDEEEYFLAEYYAEVMGVTIEEALKGCIMDKVRELYEQRSEAKSRPKCTYEDEAVADEMYSDEDR